MVVDMYSIYKALTITHHSEKYVSNWCQDVLDELEKKGHKVEVGSSHRWFGGAMAITNNCGEPCESSSGIMESKDMKSCYKTCIKATADWRAEEDARKGPEPDGY